MEYWTVEHNTIRAVATAPEKTLDGLNFLYFFLYFSSIFIINVTRRFKRHFAIE